MSGNQKQQLRKNMALEKKKLSFEELVSLSQQILNQLEEREFFLKAKTVLLYHALKDEVQTISFIRKWGNLKRIFLPVVKGDILELRLYKGEQHLETGSFTIKEPDDDCEICHNYSEIDLAVIPGVAFDLQGNRLGRGKGYYDRLLQHLDCSKIGICFDFQLLPEIPAEPHDIKMNQVITEINVFPFIP